MIGSLVGSARRKAVVGTMVLAAALGSAVVSVAPANAAPKLAVSGSAAGPVAPDGEGSSSWVTETIVDNGSQVNVSAWMNFPAPFMFPTGHWQILTPTEHFNTGDGPYQDFHGSFPNARGNYCAIWWYLDGSGNYINKGEPCVGN
jgi:hypothetical protein